MIIKGVLWELTLFRKLRSMKEISEHLLSVSPLLGMQYWSVFGGYKRNSGWQYRPQWLMTSQTLTPDNRYPQSTEEGRNQWLAEASWSRRLHFLCISESITVLAGLHKNVSWVLKIGIRRENMTGREKSWKRVWIRYQRNQTYLENATGEDWSWRILKTQQWSLNGLHQTIANCKPLDI